MNEELKKYIIAYIDQAVEGLITSDEAADMIIEKAEKLL